jgi:D-serine dehydratase
LGLATGGCAGMGSKPMSVAMGLRLTWGTRFWGRFLDPALGPCATWGWLWGFSGLDSILLAVRAVSGLSW